MPHQSYSFLLRNTSILFHSSRGPFQMVLHLPTVSLSCDISFLLAYISIATSFLTATSSSISGFCFIPFRQLFHIIFHSCMVGTSLRLQSLVAISSSSLGLCFIPLRRLLHVIFYSPTAGTSSQPQSLMEISSSSLVICFIPPR